MAATLLRVDHATFCTAQLLQLGKKAEAKTMLEQSMKISEQSYGDYSSTYTSACINLGMTLLQLNELDRGLELIQRGASRRAQRHTWHTYNPCLHDYAAAAEGSCGGGGGGKCVDALRHDCAVGGGGAGATIAEQRLGTDNNVTSQAFHNLGYAHSVRKYAPRPRPRHHYHYVHSTPCHCHATRPHGDVVDG